MTQLPNDALGLAIYLHGALTQKSSANRCCEGILPDNYNYQQVVNLLDSCGILISDEPAQRRVEFSYPNNFFNDIDEFLVAPSRRIAVPPSFYIANMQFLFQGDRLTAPQLLKNYFQATDLFKALRSVAYEIPKGQDIELVFLSTEKIHLTSNYNQADLKSLENLSSFNDDFISSTAHKEQKTTIIKTAVNSLFNKENTINFSEILNRFEEFFSQINSSYQLYVSEFSFAKIKAEVEKEKLEFITKLNKVFSDIQSQLLAIPAALILIGSQMEVNTNWSIKNVLIWLGALIFSLLMNLLIRNQRHTLNAIKIEIDQQKHLIKTKHVIVADQFLGVYEQLEKRYLHQKKLIQTIDALVAFSLLISTSLLVYYSTTREVALFSLCFTFITSMYISFVYFATRPIIKLFEKTSLVNSL
ncbi:MAG: hypothetical protein EOO53_17470 [Gammaproteobacteria bacterium]|nr:MAG: hypothetical protein EOO53_17470 [Gammaproteobacteria bacterium]